MATEMRSYKFLCSTDDLMTAFCCTEPAAAVNLLERLCEVALDSSRRAFEEGLCEDSEPAVSFEVIDSEPCGGEKHYLIELLNLGMGESFFVEGASAL